MPLLAQQSRLELLRQPCAGRRVSSEGLCLQGTLPKEAGSACAQDCARCAFCMRVTAGDGSGPMWG